MCGIVTICNYTRNLLEYEEKLVRMASLMTKRGPDHEGYFMTPHCLMAHRRLSIIDLKNGNQPMLYTWNDKIYTGTLQQAGRDHFIIVTDTGKTVMLLLVYLLWAEFDEPLDYQYKVK